ncbi:heparinase II/III family protein [Paenibacillus sp. HB172176]|uniref:heparinase II/III domain-containing protein n=1 Tax=Paenibacillus sp. HB172176 TaxID=2493690 RepID=UPI00143A0355|nr:heparinase II/III family protein [Paenibacillus sp. HB172176]
MAITTKAREKLQGLVNRAESILGSGGRYYTEGSKLALMDMLHAARRALRDDESLPFKRNREFYLPREEEAVLCATKRFTMVPPFAAGSSVYGRYGLEPALEWFEKQDMRYEGKEKLPIKAELALAKAMELLEEARIGSEIGCYSEEAMHRLKASAEALEQARENLSQDNSGEELAAAIVDCFNRVREFRHSRVLRSHIDPAASLYLTGEELEGIKRAVSTDSRVRGQYEEIAGIAERYTLSELEKVSAMIMNEEADYEALNREFYLWSHTDKIANFKAPEHAATASLSFILPCVENEEEGLGHVWIDNLEILSANGGSIPIRNAGFDSGEAAPAGWVPEARQGNPVMKWEQEYPYSGGGDRKQAEPANPSSQIVPRYEEGDSARSLYLCNPTKEDEGAWTYGERFAVEGGAGYTLTFAAKLDGKLKKGLLAVITFYDEAGQPAGVFEYCFNRKSSIPGGRFQLAMQCDAIQYAITGELDYARKVKQALLYILHDFCQGAEHWLTMNSRPEGSDSYGAVQGGRLLSSAAVSYSFIKQADIFSSEEKQCFYGRVEYLLRYMLDLRDRTEWTRREAQEGCSNWQTDMCAGAGLMMMTLTDFPNRLSWLYNANTILKAQLELNVNADSSWPESIRYHHAALERFAGYAKAAHNVLGDNWFETTPLARMFGFSIDMQTPGYAYFGGRIGTPPFGDHALGGGGEFGSFATYLSDISKVDKPLADRMHHTWTAAGKPFKKLWGEGIALENLMGQGEGYFPSAPLELDSTADFPDAGIYIFRRDAGGSRLSYFAIMSSPKPIAHGHLDQGSFILYKNGIPLVMDSGIEGYFDSSTSWHISSYSHACLQFATQQKPSDIRKAGDGAINLSAGTYSLERGWADVPRTSRVLDVRLSESIDSITIEILNPEGAGRHIRHVTFVKEWDLYILRDTVLDFNGKIQFTLPVAAERTVIEGNRLYSEGAYNVDLETLFLSPLQSLGLEKGRSTPFFDSGEPDVSMMDYIRAVAEARDGFLTVLYGKEHYQRSLLAELEQDGTLMLDTGDASVRLRRVKDQEGIERFALESTRRKS